MDPNFGSGQDPVSMEDNGVTSFDPSFDMSAINEVVSMSNSGMDVMGADSPNIETASPVSAPVEPVATPPMESVQIDAANIGIPENTPTDSMTIADIANSVQSESTVATAPAAMPPSSMQIEQTGAPRRDMGAQSKMPAYILAGLSVIAVALVAIAIIVSAG